VLPRIFEFSRCTASRLPEHAGREALHRAPAHGHGGCSRLDANTGSCPEAAQRRPAEIEVTASATTRPSPSHTVLVIGSARAARSRTTRSPHAHGTLPPHVPPGGAMIPGTTAMPVGLAKVVASARIAWLVVGAPVDSPR
jgi:hypothetical protein